MLKTRYRAVCMKPGCGWKSEEVFVYYVAAMIADRHEKKSGGHQTKVTRVREKEEDEEK